MTVDRLYANYVNVNGQLDVNGDFLPSGTNCIHNIGSPSNRWKGIYSCLMDTTGNLTVGGDTDVTGFVQVGDFLSVDGNADILGTVTIGTTPTSGNEFKVNSPATFDSTMVIVDDTTAKGLTLSSFLTVKGNVEIGDGCGVTTLHVYSETTFHCDVEFVKQPLTVDYLDVKVLLKSEGDTILGTTCGNDSLTVNAESLFNCLTEHEGELRVGRISGADLRAYGSLIVYEDSEFGKNLYIGQKARSAHTENSDLEDTLTTKSWVKSWVASEAGRLGYWQRGGSAIKPVNLNDSVVPYGTGGSLGNLGERWNGIFGNTLNLAGKGVSASTVDGDTGSTLTTKDWVTQSINAVAPRDGKINFNSGVGLAEVGSNASADQGFDTTKTFSIDRSIVDTWYAPANTISAEDGQIRFNAGDGLSETGNNATANQSIDTLKTFSVKAADSTILVSANGIRVNPNGLSNANLVGDVVIGDGCATSTLNIDAATTLSCDMIPFSDSIINLGSASNRFANIYTGDLHLKNERGDWTLIEEEDCLTMRNNKTGKRYAISMTPYEG